MKSPFPGMDPFIEARHLWGDFHGHMIVAMQRSIDDQLPARYVARIGERVFFNTEDPEVELILRNRMEPDVEIVKKTAEFSTSPASARVAVALADPPQMELPACVEFEDRETFLDIYKLDPDRKLVTSIEILSPSNKRRGSAGWDQYERKRSIFIHGHAHLVEIDLLRRGRRHAMVESWPDSPYVISVLRREKAPVAEIWQAYSLQPLPKIPIPLKSPDPDIVIALQPLVEEIYERSRYFDDMKYGEPIKPPLAPDEARFLTGFLAEGKTE